MTTPKRTCYGTCLEQTEKGYIKSNKACPEKCVPIPCIICRELLPEWAAKEDKYCINCHVMKFSAKRAGKNWARIEAGLIGGTHCHSCCGRLVAIGNSRVNGRDHDDWGTRKYHKKCWLAIKKRQEEDDACSTEEDDK